MKIIQINSTCGIGSTGKICVGISQVLSEAGIENYILYSSKSNGYEYGVKCSNDNYIKTQALKSKISGNYGFYSSFATQKMIKELERIRPDIVHLHNIHGHDCNIELLFKYFKNNKTKLVWTFHDCWAFTGYCPHFTMAKCDKWQTECIECPQRIDYSWIIDNSNKLFKRKKELFSDIDLTVVTPSKWLADMVKKSFLKEYPIYIINNGIDLSIFKYIEGDFRKKHSLEDKKIVLGVAFDWSIRKGLDVLIELSKKLPDEYKIVIVGASETIEKQLPKNIISVRCTQNQQELAEIYSSADVFINPTREENYPTVNMEAIACGTPVVTFRTGGSAEMLDETCGSVVECEDFDSLEKEIIRICTDRPYIREICVKKSKDFNKYERYKEYLNLYERINTTRT